MNIAMIKQFSKEGVVNVFRHPLVTLASITTIALMLVLMGSFYIFSKNANDIATNASTQPPILIWVEYGASREVVDNIRDSLNEISSISTLEMQTPDDNFEAFKEELGENSHILEGFDSTLLPYTFTVQLVAGANPENFKIITEGMQGVRRVEYSQPVTEFLNSVRSTVNLITMIAFIVLAGITFFIISNMVKVAVFSRSEEIGIMKYVGATNRYIRIPFIIEGTIVGFVGAVLASFIVLFAYSIILEKTMDPVAGNSLFQLLNMQEVFRSTIYLNVLFGVLIGAIGSGVSVRRHVKV